MVQERSVLIVDDHPLFREGLKAIIGRDVRFKVVGEAGNGSEGLRMARQLRPALIVMDISLPDKNGIQLARELRDLLPETHIMIVSVHSKIDYIAEAFQAGVTGYVVKESASARLLTGLESVSKGEYFLDDSIAPAVVGRLKKFSGKGRKITDAGYGTLTSREQEVMRMMVEGLSCRKIAEALSVTPKTIRNYSSEIIKKLGIRNIAELVRYAAKIGLIDVEVWDDRNCHQGFSRPMTGPGRDRSP